MAKSITYLDFHNNKDFYGDKKLTLTPMLCSVDKKLAFSLPSYNNSLIQQNDHVTTFGPTRYPPADLACRVYKQGLAGTRRGLGLTVTVTEACVKTVVASCVCVCVCVCVC